MRIFTAFLSVLVANVRAHGPPCSSVSNISDVALFYQIDAAISLLNADSGAKALLNGITNVTVLATLNIPLYQYFEALIPGPLSPAAKVAELGRPAAPELKDLFRYIILNGTYDSASLKNGFNFVPSFLFDPPKYHLSQPAKVGIYIDDLRFYLRTGQNRTSNVVLKDIPFSNGIIHIVTLPLGELFSISSTAATIGLKSLQRLVAPDAAPYVNNLTDVTVFVPSNEVRTGKVPNWGDYFFDGNIAYSTILTPGKTFRAKSSKKLLITQDIAGVKYVNGVRILSTDILVSNGVVHTIAG
ncbi:hypothetical protein MMC22_006854 [Lobaria immixta]|nr:hypothetical protein [Lobaria immixta]